ncbi:MAG: TetR/AcrR family transcriptional regulator [Lachnospiraceae bacterium]|nr:TetR/AcrR family transcriptional regulator [Lachnospiraceae bacterium]
MDFVRARTEAQMQARQLDIMQACNSLFEQGGYDAVNIKAISEMTSITRPSFYTYYKTKDEVLLDLLKTELLFWKEELLEMIETISELSSEQFAETFTHMLAAKDKMLHLYSLLFTSLEQNCRIEKLVDFKRSIMPTMMVFTEFLLKCMPWLTEDQAALLNTELITYVLGLYPMSHLTKKQLDAVELSSTGYHSPEFEPLCKLGTVAFINALRQ